MFRFSGRDGHTQEALARASGLAPDDPGKDLAELAADAELPLEELRRRVYGGREGSGSASVPIDRGVYESDGGFSSGDFGTEDEEEEEEEGDDARGGSGGRGRAWGGFGERRIRSGGLEELLTGGGDAMGGLGAIEAVSRECGQEGRMGRTADVCGRCGMSMISRERL